MKYFFVFCPIFSVSVLLRLIILYAVKDCNGLTKNQQNCRKATFHTKYKTQYSRVSVASESLGDTERNIFEQFIFIKLPVCSPEFHSQKVPLLLVFNKSSTSAYGSFLILRIGKCLFYRQGFFSAQPQCCLNF